MIFVILTTCNTKNKKNSWKIIVGHISHLKKHWKYTSDHASLEMTSVSQYYLSPKELDV